MPLFLTVPGSVSCWKAVDEHGAGGFKGHSQRISWLAGAHWAASWLGYCPPAMSLCKDSWAPNALLQPSPAALVPQQGGSGFLPPAGTYLELQGLQGPCCLVKVGEYQ